MSEFLKTFNLKQLIFIFNTGKVKDVIVKIKKR